MGPSSISHNIKIRSSIYLFLIRNQYTFHGSQQRKTLTKTAPVALREKPSTHYYHCRWWFVRHRYTGRTALLKAPLLGDIFVGNATVCATHSRRVCVVPLLLFSISHTRVIFAEHYFITLREQCARLCSKGRKCTHHVYHIRCRWGCDENSETNV